MLAKSRRLSSERCLSLLNLLVTHSAWSHLSLACVWPGNLTSKHISACVFVRCCCLPLDQLSSKTDTGFQHEANWSNVFFLISAEELMAELSKPSNNSARFKPPLWSLPRALEKKKKKRFALLFLCALISLFQLMFHGCAQQEVRTFGGQSWYTDDKSRSNFCNSGMTGD